MTINLVNRNNSYDVQTVHIYAKPKVVIRKSKDSKHNGLKKMDNWKNNDLQTLCKNVKIKQHEPL
jgi:hypothetical protein